MDYVVDGRVVQEGSDARITIEVIDDESGTIYWDQTYGVSYEEFVSIRDEAVRDIVVSVGGEFTSRTASYDPVTQAWEAFQKGFEKLDTQETDSMYVALGLFEEAVQLDSLWAPPYAAITRTVSVLRDRELADAALLSRAQWTANQSIKLDSLLLDSWLAKGISAGFENRHLDLFAAVKKMESIDPADHRTLFHMARVRRFVAGLNDAETLRLYERALERSIEQRGINQALILWHIAFYVHAMQNNRAEAIQAAQEIIDSYPGHLFTNNANLLISTYRSPIGVTLDNMRNSNRQAGNPLEGELIAMFQVLGVTRRFELADSIYSSYPDSIKNDVHHLFMYALNSEWDDAFATLDRMNPMSDAIAFEWAFEVAGWVPEFGRDPRWLAVLEAKGIGPQLFDDVE